MLLFGLWHAVQLLVSSVIASEEQKNVMEYMTKTFLKSMFAYNIELLSHYFLRSDDSDEK